MTGADGFGYEPPAYGPPGPPGSPPPPGAPGTYLLGAPEPAPRSRRRGLVVGAGVVAALAIAGTAYAAWSMLSGGGAQPEDALPGNVVAYAEIDLDPGAGQKVNAYRLAKKFPDSGVKGEASIKDDLLRQLFQDEELDYDRDIKPWVGDRAGVAVLDELDVDEQPYVGVAVQYSDETKARAGLERAVKAASEQGTGDGSAVGFAFGSDGYVILSDTTENAERFVDAAKKGSLADNAAYGKALDALDGDQVAMAWVDIGGVFDLVPEDARRQVLALAPDADPEGAYVLGLSVRSDSIDFVGKGVGLDLGDLGYGALTQGGKGELLAQMPADSLAAASSVGLGEGLVEVYDKVRELGKDDDAFDTSSLFEAAAEAGVKLPDDITALFGEETAIAVLDGEDQPLVAGRSRGGDPARGKDVIKALVGLDAEDVGAGFSYGSGSSGSGSGSSGFEEYCSTLTPSQRETLSCDQIGSGPADEVDLTGLVEEYEGGLVVGSHPKAVDALTRDGNLDQEPSFDKALPDGGDSSFAVFVNLARIFDQHADDLDLRGSALANVKPLDAVGLTAGGSEFHFRVTFR